MDGYALLAVLALVLVLIEFLRLLATIGDWSARRKIIRLSRERVRLSGNVVRGQWHVRQSGMARPEFIATSVLLVVFFGSLFYALSEFFGW